MQGAIEMTREFTDGMLQRGYDKEKRDQDSLAKGFRGLTADNLHGVCSTLLRISRDLTSGDTYDDPHPVSVDTSMLALVLLARFIGVSTIRREYGNDVGGAQTLSTLEQVLLPAVCMYLAFKLDERIPSHNILEALIATSKTGQSDTEDEVSILKKGLNKLERKVTGKLGFFLLSETPITFLHLYIPRAISEGALDHDVAVRIGVSATELSFQWVSRGFLSSLKPSEIAAAALHTTVLRLQGPKEADTVIVAAGCAADAKLDSERMRPLYSDAGCFTHTQNPRAPGKEAVPKTRAADTRDTFGGDENPGRDFLKIEGDDAMAVETGECHSDGARRSDTDDPTPPSATEEETGKGGLRKEKDFFPLQEEVRR